MSGRQTCSALALVLAWQGTAGQVCGGEPAAAGGAPAPLPEAQAGPRNQVRNGSFEEGTAESLPGWERLPWGKGSGLDEALAHSGRRSLRVPGHGGYRTDLIAYAGGRIQATGWMKTLAVVTGSRPWYKAALQVISYDRGRRPVGHHDVALVDGTHDWTPYSAHVLLSREVAYISVDCHLWGEDATGTAWFDDIGIEFLDDPAVFARPPLDLARAAVDVDLDRDLGPFRHLWSGSDVGWMDRVDSDTQINAMRQARQAGFRYIRLHDCIFNPRVYAEDPAGRPVYRWDTFDRRIGLVVDNGMLPMIVLESMPVELAGQSAGRDWNNPFPPKDDAAYRKWQELVHQLVLHCRERWGEVIHEWYFEVWNEPDASEYFKGTLAEYLRLYDHAVAGAVAAEPGIRIGGTGGAGDGWCQAFLEHCNAGRNDATGGTGSRVDFLSWHIYTVGSGVPCFDVLRLSLAAGRQAAASFPRFRGLPLLITEWGCSSGTFAAHDRPYDAAFRTLAVREFLDAGIEMAMPFCLGEGPPHAHEGFLGGLALFTKTTVPKPSFRAFELLHRMEGRRVACDSSNDPVGGLACRGLDGKRVWIMLYNLLEDSTVDAYSTAVTVRLKGLPVGEWVCRSFCIAPDGCDPYVAWQNMGSPESLTPAQRETLLAASELPPAQPLAVEPPGVLRPALPGFSVMLLELSRP
jgi:xylan 1,4-beta-xylosidase